MPSSAQTVVEEHQNLLTVTETLVREHHPATAAGTVINTVRRCRNELMQAGVRAGLSVAVETMARARLRQGADKPLVRSGSARPHQPRRTIHPHASAPLTC